MKIMSLFKKIVCTIALVALSTAHGTTRLIGISNRTNAHAGVPAPVISISGTEYTGIPITDPMVGAKIKRLKDVKLPITVTITYKDKTINEGKPYTIEIKELTADEQGLKGERCGDGTKTIQAWLTQFNKNDAKTCCVTLAKNAFSANKDSFEWQNVLLAFANNPQYGQATGIKGLPFLFGIAPWTTTKAPWDDTLITIPADEPEGTPDQFTHVWETGPEKGYMGLKVMQGNPAWMGDNIKLNILPKKGCDNIVHIYNNSPYIINIIRDIREGTGGDFKKLLPPWSATPWVMAWIPTVPSANFKPRDQVSAIKLCALYAPDPTCPKPLARIMPILRTAGSAEFSYNQGIPFEGSTKGMMDELKALYTPDMLGPGHIRRIV